VVVVVTEEVEEAVEEVDPLEWEAEVDLVVVVAAEVDEAAPAVVDL